MKSIETLLYDTSRAFELIFKNKYSYLGYTYLGVPTGWKPIVSKLLKDMDRIVKPKWTPRIILNIISYMATGGSVVRMESKFWYNILHKLTKGIKIMDIKEKYAGLRVYGSFSDEIYALIDQAETDCENTCQYCGSHNNVELYDPKGWVYNICEECRNEMNITIKNLSNRIFKN